VFAQNDPYLDSYASIEAGTSSYKVVDAKINTSNSFAARETIVSEAFLDANNGFIGIVFNEAISKPNIYYTIVDMAGKEVYNGSTHAYAGGQPTLYYNTENLPAGEYRIFINNDDFFLSTNFVK